MGPDPLGPDQVGVLHPQRRTDVLAQIVIEGLAGHVRDELAEGGEPVVAVHPLGSRLDLHRQAPPVVVGERRHRSARPDARADTRLKQVRQPPPVADPGGMGQQMPHGRGSKARLGRNQPQGAQVVVGRGIQVDQPLLPQLHHGDRGEGLGDRADPEHRVLRDRLLGLDVGDAVAQGPLQGSITDDANRKTGRGPAVQDLGDLAPQLELIHNRHGSPIHREGGTARAGAGALSPPGTSSGIRAAKASTFCCSPPPAAP